MDTRAIIDEAGGPTRVARLLGLRSHTAVLKWQKVPDHWLIKLEAATGIPRERLRPDLFERPAPASERPAQEVVNG